MNLRRVAAVVLGVLSSAVMASDSDISAEGEAVYDRLCMACHQSGVAGAPVRGDRDDWALRLEQDFETLLRHSIDGIGAMPPRGGNPNLSDDEMRAATVYLLEPVIDETGSLDGGGVEGNGPDDIDHPPLPAEPDVQPTLDDEDETSAGRPLDGEALYAQARCATCHATGIARSPALGDTAAWRERLEQGREVLYQSVIDGKGIMPPRGASNATDEELEAMVDFMIERSR